MTASPAPSQDKKAKIDEIKLDPNKELQELNNQLALSRRIGFFLGAGVSASLGIPDITVLSKSVGEGLSEASQKNYGAINTSLKTHIKERQPTVEDALNHLRLIRLLTQELATKEFEGITGQKAKDLDKEICEKICEKISIQNPGHPIWSAPGGIQIQRRFDAAVF